MKQFNEPIFLDFKQPFIILIDVCSPFLFQVQCNHIYCTQKQVRGYILPIHTPFDYCFQHGEEMRKVLNEDLFKTCETSDLYSALKLTEDMVIREAFVYIDIEFKEKQGAIFKGVLSWENCD